MATTETATQSSAAPGRIHCLERLEARRLRQATALDPTADWGIGLVGVLDATAASVFRPDHNVVDQEHRPAAPRDSGDASAAPPSPRRARLRP